MFGPKTFVKTSLGPIIKTVQVIKIQYGISSHWSNFYFKLAEDMVDPSCYRLETHNNGGWGKF